MMTEFEVQGWWIENEASGAASALLSRYDAGDEFINDFHIQVKADTEDGIVRIVSDDLSKEQIAVLRNYFENHPEQDMPDWEREKLVADKARKAEVEAVVKKVIDSRAESLNVVEVRDALRALAELAGVEL